MALHHAEELDDDLRGGSDEHLALASSLGIDNVVLQRHELPDNAHATVTSPGSRSGEPSACTSMPQHIPASALQTYQYRDADHCGQKRK